MKTVKLFTFLSLILLAAACKKAPAPVEKPQGGAFVEDLYKNLTASIVRDQFSPLVAARVYTYSLISAHEAALPFYSGSESFAGKLTDFEGVPKPDNIEELDSNVVVLTAFCAVGKMLTFKNHSLLNFEKEQIEKYTNLIGQERVAKSVEYGKKVGEAVLGWAGKDNYVEIRKAPKYKANTDSRENWLPTFPDYNEALCPYWNTLRPMILDSATQFPIDKPTAFDSVKGSPFYEENMMVYNVSKEIDSTKKFIAFFWDDNPNVTVHHGHMGFSELKLTPGGHWMSIAATTCRRERKDMMQSLKITATASIAIFDGFITCWQEKFKYDYIRPITYISRYIDRDWVSFLQTPNFPEYPSGHSVVSGSASTVLTHFFGDKYVFVDSSEVEYLHGVRSFNSFNEAAEEAAISRMYGGIHFTPAIENGITLGRNVGNMVIKELQ